MPSSPGAHSTRASSAEEPAQPISSPASSRTTAIRPGSCPVAASHAKPPGWVDAGNHPDSARGMSRTASPGSPAISVRPAAACVMPRSLGGAAGAAPPYRSAFAPSDGVTVKTVGPV
ncbi:hypothetical protein ABID70_001797 [Clavibacter michiganensis]